MINHPTYELQMLRTHMARNNLAPEEDLIADNETHFYTIKRGGKEITARYLAVPYPFGNEGPSLICSYGPIDIPNSTYYYSSLNKN